MDTHDKILFDYNPVTQRKVEIEKKDGVLVVHESVNPKLVQAHLEMNKSEYNAVRHKGYKAALQKAKFWRAASIPNIIIEKWKKEEGLDIFNDEHWERIKVKLNSEEFKFLRTSPGKI
jgi:hypothetical protein